MDKKVYILGHQNPDTDSICSAIAYADFKRQMGFAAVPVRIGRINQETAFVLQYFGIEVPEYLSTAKTQVNNLEMDVTRPVSAEISLKDAWQILKENNLKVLPVEDENHKLCGLVSVSDIAKAYMDMPKSNLLSLSRTSLENVIHTLDARLIWGSGSFYGSGKTIIAAVTPDIMGNYIEKGDIIITGNREDNQIRAIEAGASCVVITCGTEAEEEVVILAREKNCTLLVTEYDTFTAASLLYQSIPVGFIMTNKDLTLFRMDDYIDTVREQMLQSRYRSYPVVDNDGYFQGFISRYHLINHKRKQLILVDHSEKSQSVSGIEQANIMEIIDHHRIGDVQTSQPIYYRNEPVGSTATIVANLFYEQGLQPLPKIAGLLCSAILSDTVSFKSPISTQKDKKTAKMLAEISGINIEKFSLQMFQHAFSLKNMMPEEILQNDFKEYVIQTQKIGIGQVNTADLRSAKKARRSILQKMNEIMSKDNFCLVMLLVTDIINEVTEVLFVETQKGLVAKVFNPLNDENSLTLNGVVSRKKQIVPVLTDLLTEMYGG